MLFFIFCIALPLLYFYFSSPGCPGCGKRESMKLDNKVDENSSVFVFKCKHCGYSRTEVIQPLQSSTGRWINNQLHKVADKLGK